jgi:hypothetical protein
MFNRSAFGGAEAIIVSKTAILSIILLSVLTPAFSQQQGAAPPATGTVTTAVPATAVALNHRRLAPENTYTRVYCIVPIIGTGTAADPRRPMFAPLPPTATAPINRGGIVAYQFQESDDGNFALVEFVSVFRDGLAPILSSTSPNVVSFERGKHTRQEIETAFQKYKKSFSFDKFMPVRAQ